MVEDVGRDGKGPSKGPGGGPSKGPGSAGRKVSKAARTGGGITKKGRTSGSPVFPGILAVVVVLGVLLVTVSRNGRAEADSTPPIAGRDHWHAALGFYICGSFTPDITDQTDPRGIHTHGDGVVHIHPFTARSGGRFATLGVYFDAVDVKVTDSSITGVPGSPPRKNGDECDGRKSVVQTRVWDFDDPEDTGRVHVGDPSDLKPDDRSLVTVAFMPEGAEIPKPPSADNLDQLTDLGPTAPPPGAEEIQIPGPEGAPAEGAPAEGAPAEGAPAEVPGDDPTIGPTEPAEPAPPPGG
ncbi:MAG: hypothetical protein ACT4OS_06560 [Acidimicrobiales bacterium]